MIKEQIQECIQKILDSELGGISTNNCPRGGIEKYGYMTAYRLSKYVNFYRTRRISLDDLSSGRNTKYDISNHNELLSAFGYYKEDIEKIKDEPQYNLELMYLIGRKRGCLVRGNEVDYNKVSNIIIKDLRDGYLGKVTFDER